MSEDKVSIAVEAEVLRDMATLSESQTVAPSRRILLAKVVLETLDNIEREGGGSFGIERVRILRSTVLNQFGLKTAE